MINHTCVHCGKDFVSTRRSSRYCSHSCVGQAYLPNIRKPIQGQTLSCEYCLRAFFVPQYRGSKARFCSRSCLAKVHLAQFAAFWFQPSGKPPHRYKTMVTPDGRQVRIHRYIMEQHLGRRLEAWEHVHHINGDSLDNRIKNLIVLSNSAHQRVEYAERGRN